MSATFQIPLFPLHTVLFPEGVLPLRIFEVRYLDLVQRCLKEGAPFGVVCLTQGSEVRRAPIPGERGEPVQEAFHTVGTLAHIMACERPQPGFMRIRCRGGRRIRLLASEQLRHGLWTAQAQYLADDPLVPVPPDLAPVRLALQRLLQQLQSRAGAGDELPIQPPYAWDDCGWVANRWCDLLPVSPQLKQQFLAVDSPLLRLELVSDLLARLQIGAGSA
jgi:hypothetical protein